MFLINTKYKNMLDSMPICPVCDTHTMHPVQYNKTSYSYNITVSANTPSEPGPSAPCICLQLHKLPM